MLSEALQQKVDRYTDIYAQLKNALSWKVSDKRTLMIVASMYVVNHRPFDLQRFKELSQFIKHQVGMFSPLHSYHRYTTAAMLDVRFDHPEEMFREMMNVYNALVDGGFRKGVFTYIAAVVMLGEESTKSQDYAEKVQRAFAVYRGMKEHHFFLTTHNDYPLAVLLAERQEDVSELLVIIEDFYSELSSGFYRKGNHLQFLSHILSIDRKTDRTVLVDRCSNIYHQLKQEGISTKSMFYPEMGLLALLENGEQEVARAKALLEKLTSIKYFKWHKDIHFIMAVNFIVSEKTEHQSLVDTGIYTTIEAIIQAQQAAMVAAVAASSAAAASSSSS